jgi:hypothetical protein
MAKLCIGTNGIFVIIAVAITVLIILTLLDTKVRTKVTIKQEPAGSDIYHNRITDPLLAPERTYPVYRTPVMTRFNSPTRGEQSGYQQVGALIEQTQNGTRRMLPLYGSRSTYNSNRWNYYANTDGYQSVKLPVLFKGKNCQDEFGCDEIYDNDDLNVQGYDFPYKATIYKVDRPRY